MATLLRCRISSWLLVAFLAVVSCSSSCCFVAAQYSAATQLCGAMPFDLDSDRVYFTAEVDGISEFEYRLIANDGRALGLKELYDIDESDETATNYDCFVESTMDDTTCPNTYLAGGYVLPTFPQRTIRFGFERCMGTSAPKDGELTRNATLQLWYRQTPNNDLTLQGTCATLMEVAPGAFCSRSGAAARETRLGGIVTFVMFALFMIMCGVLL